MATQLREFDAHWCETLADLKAQIDDLIADAGCPAESIYLEDGSNGSEGMHFQLIERPLSDGSKVVDLKVWS